MATGETQTVTTGPRSSAKWASWIAALVGLWVIVSPFVLTGPIAIGTVMWSNVVAGIAILVLSAYGAYAIRSAPESASSASGEWSG